MKYSELYGLKSGDRLVSTLFATGLSKHHAIFFIYHGKEYIAENDSIKGVQIIEAEIYFSRERNIIRIEKFSGDEFQRFHSIQRIINLQGKAYNLFIYNCEHFANEVQFGKPSSSQVNNFIALLSVFFIGLVLIKN